jgi:hypothetical protein
VKRATWRSSQSVAPLPCVLMVDRLVVPDGLWRLVILDCSSATKIQAACTRWCGRGPCAPLRGSGYGGEPLPIVNALGWPRAEGPRPADLRQGPLWGSWSEAPQLNGSSELIRLSVAEVRRCRYPARISHYERRGHSPPNCPATTTRTVAVSAGVDEFSLRIGPW